MNPKSKVVRLPEPLWRRVKAVADRRNVSVDKQVEIALGVYLQRHE